MNLDAFLVSPDVQPRVVKLPDGSEHTLHFRELPAVEFRKLHMAEQSEDENVRAGAMAKMIAASLCEPDGTPAMDYAQALRLKTGAMTALMDAVLAVNGLKGSDAGKG
jgi:hypothetical protein